MRILIAGAGIGGLTAALCLQKAGYEVKVYEQAPAFKEVGAGLQCGANALKVMAHLDLLSELEAVSVEPHRVEFRDYHSGKALYKMQLGTPYREKYGAPYYHLHRADLQSVLVAALNKRAPGALEMNAQLSDYCESASAVSLQLSDGRSVQGDLLVGADGVKSQVREQLLNERQLAYKHKFTGMVAWRGVVPVSRLPEHFMDKVTANFIGPGKHMVIYYLRKQQLVNFVGVVENRDWRDESWVEKAPWAELKADFEGWHTTVQTVIDAVEKDQCYRWALYEHAPLRRWGSQRATLLGDAAHMTLPFMASGAAMAIEDARVLQRALGQAASIETAIQLYQSNRLNRTARIQRRSVTMGKLYHSSNRSVKKAAFSAIRLAGGRAEAFLPEYDANSVELV